MTRPDDAIRLRHMLDYAETCSRLVADRVRPDLEADEVLRLALTRAVEVIGEAAAALCEELQSEHPQVPWRQIVATRHRLIHGYDSVDLDILWHIATVDVPPLIDQLNQILRMTGGSAS